MKPAVLVVLLAMLASSPPAIASNCSLWNAWEFFEHATPSDVSECLKLGANVNTTDRYGWTPLHVAAYGGHAEAVNVLLAAGSEVNAREWDGDTPLHSAAIGCDAGVVKVLLETGAGLDATDRSGSIPLHAAAGSGCPETVRVLLEAGARVNARDKDGATPLDAARDMMKRTRKSTEPYGEVIRILKARGARPGRER